MKYNLFIKDHYKMMIIHFFARNILKSKFKVKEYIKTLTFKHD